MREELAHGLRFGYEDEDHNAHLGATPLQMTAIEFKPAGRKRGLAPVQCLQVAVLRRSTDMI